MASLAEMYLALRERSKAGRPVDFEALLRRFYTGLLTPGDIAVDVGAFQGTHTLPIADAIRVSARNCMPSRPIRTWPPPCARC